MKEKKNKYSFLAVPYIVVEHRDLILIWDSLHLNE